MLIDTHTHFLPTRLGQAVRRFFAEHGVPPLAHPLDPRQALVDHLDVGATAIWNLPYAHKAGVAAGLNAAMQQVAADLADIPIQIVTGCTVHPSDPDPAADLELAVEAGAKVLKLHCSVGGYTPDHPSLAAVLDHAGQAGIPVVVHVGHAPDGTSAAADLSTLGVVADRHPDTVLIVAHTSHPATQATGDLMRSHPNVWADLTPVLFDLVDVTAEDLSPVADRILLGTDTPNVGMRLPVILDWLNELGLEDDERTAILHGNARRLVAVN